MKTAAEILGYDPDAAMEAAKTEFSAQQGRIEQEETQQRLGPVDRLRRDWIAAEAIVRAHRRATHAPEEAP